MSYQNEAMPVETHLYAPTLEEIRIGMGLSSKSVVAYHLTALEEEGYIWREPGKVRAIWVVEREDTLRGKGGQEEGSSQSSVGRIQNGGS